MLSVRDLMLQIVERVTWTHNAGRVIPADVDTSQPSILVFAAHPDDDVLGVGITMYRHVLEGNRVRVTFTSNGGGHHRSRRDMSREAQTRYDEACAALSHAGITERDVACLGFPDGRLYRYMTHMAIDVKQLIEQTKPRRVYVHSIEGGHRDHDVTGFVVQGVCKQMGYSEVYEWTEYNALQTLRDDPIDFPPYPQEVPYQSVRLVFTPEERALKHTMLMAHLSQVSPMGLAAYEGRSELVRRCNYENLTLRMKHFWEYCISTDRIDWLIEDFELYVRDM